MLTSEMCLAHCRPSLAMRLARLARKLWWRFVAAPPVRAEVEQARVVYGRSGPGVVVSHNRVIPMACHKPDGSFEMGWLVRGQNDGAIVEVLCAWMNRRATA